MSKIDNIDRTILEQLVKKPLSEESIKAEVRLAEAQFKLAMEYLKTTGFIHESDGVFTITASGRQALIDYWNGEGFKTLH